MTLELWGSLNMCKFTFKGTVTMRKLKRKALAMTGVIALISGGYAQADLLEYSFTGVDGNQRTLSANAKYGNPTGTMTFALSAGVDRKVRVSMLNSAGRLLNTATSNLLGANDRITVGGKEYYGSFLNLPAPSEGHYKIKAEILAGDGKAVKVDIHSLFVDLTPPAASPMIATNTGYKQDTASSVWKLGTGGSEKTYFRVSDVLDESPIKETKIFIYRGDGTLHSESDASFDVPNRQIDVLNKYGILPSSNLDEDFKVQITAQDEAGNTWKSQLQTVRWDNAVNAPKVPFGVFDPDSNNQLGPGLTGFVPYKAGMEVKTNPVRLAYRIEKSNWHEYSPGGLNLVNSLGEAAVAGSDNDYVYLYWSAPFGNVNGNFTRWVNFGSWGGESISYSLQLSPKAPKTPVLKEVEYNYSDIGWGSFIRYEIPNDKLPYSFDKIRVNAEKRSFNQVASHRGSCVIPAGQTSCIINSSYTMKPGTSGYIHDAATVKSEDGKLRASDRWAEVHWNDQHYPSLTYDYSEVEQKIKVFITQPARGSYFDRLRLRTAWLEDASGKKLSVSGGLIEENGQYYTYQWDLKTLAEGNYQLYAVAQERHGPLTKIPLFPYSSDKTPPKVTLMTTGDGAISSLDQFIINVTDTYDSSPKVKSIRLEGGPASDRVQLSWREETPGTFSLEYPIMFPSMQVGEEYTLTVTAEDSQGNSTTANKNFMYEPAQISLADGMDGKLMIPAIAHEFKRLDGGNIIQTEPIKLGGNTVVSGVYDVFATLRSDAQIPLVVNGILISPGETMNIMNQHDFSSSGGRIDLPLRPANSGEEGTSNLLVMTSAPNSPVLVLNVNTWVGKAKLSAENWEVRQIIDPVSISASPAAGVACRLSSDENAAKASDAVRDPVCLLEWEQVPDETESVDSFVGGLKLTGLKGQAVALGEQPVSYSLYLYSGGSRKVRVGGGQSTLSVISALNSVAYKPLGELAEVNRVIQEFDVRMRQNVGPSCSLTLDATRAQDAAANRQVGNHASTCLFEWIDIPDGMQQDQYSETPYLFGTLRDKKAHTLRWRVSIYSKSGTRVTLATEQHDIEAIDPPAPEINIFSSYHHKDEVFMVPIEGGYLGDAIIEGELTPIDVLLTRDSVELTNETFQPGRGVNNKIFRRMDTEKSALWNETLFNVQGSYNFLPEVKTTKQIRAIAVPGYDIRPSINMSVSEAMDTAPLPVTVNIADRMRPEVKYDSKSMGDWAIRLVREEGFEELIPMTDFVDAPNGVVQFNLDLAGIERSVRLIAEAKLKSPIDGYDRVEKSQRVFLTVLRGNAIGASVEGRRLAGAAPFATILQLSLDNRADTAATGDVIWEVSNDGGASWEATRVTDRNRFRWYKTYDKGEYLVRAKVFNVHSKAESYTETIEIIAYDTPEVEVVGAKTLFAGSEANYLVKVTNANGEPMENAVVKWTEDRGDTFFHEGNELTLTSESEKRFSMEAWVRDEDAPDEDRYAYTRKRVYADFRRVKGPRVFMVGPRVIETGETYNYQVRLSLPYREMDAEIDGYFTLPNGEQVKGEELEYTPTESDLALGSIELQYTAWIKGYKDQGTEASQDIRARVWEYVWPDFNLYTRSNSNMAPADVTARVRTIAFRGQLDDAKYVWELPQGDTFTVTDNRWSDMRTFLITAPGKYPVKVTITDARGNKSVIESTLDIKQAPPYEVGINYSASNDYNREPLELSLRPLLSGGHPRDRVEERIYKVNGQEIETNGYSARTVLQKGKHEVSLIMRTRMGKEISKTLEMNIVENQPPTCSIRVDDKYSSWAFYAECKDTDGSMNAFEWKVNGNPVSVRSNRLTMSKYAYDNVMPLVELTGFDDGGAASNKATAQ